MESSIFSDKEKQPSEDALKKALGISYEGWLYLRKFVCEKYPGALTEWNFPGKKYGWSFRIKDKKRAIIYLLPRQGYFKVAFVFGNKAMEVIRNSPIAPTIIQELENARVYAEGRGIRIQVKDESILRDIEMLVEIKLKH